MKLSTYEQYQDVFAVVVLGGIWIFPGLLSSAGMGIVIAWVYGVLIARLLRMMVQYSILQRGGNRRGVMALGIATMLLGGSYMYFAWEQEMFTWLGIGWILVYAGYEIAHAAYRKRLGGVRWEMMVYLQYLVVGLLVVAVFASYIQSSALGALDIQYQGLAGESLVALAWVIASSELVHHFLVRMQIRMEKMLKR